MAGEFLLLPGYPNDIKAEVFISGELFDLFEFSGCRTGYCFFSSAVFVEWLLESGEGWREDVCLVCATGQGTQNKHCFPGRTESL